MVDDKTSMLKGERLSGSAGQESGRRASRIVHDERGNARLEWVNLPNDRVFGERPALAVIDDGSDSRGTPAFTPARARTAGFNPYQRAGVITPDPATAPRPKRDLRKLSEWIKVAREVADRKARGEDVG
jgi:hypothetical protein